MKVRIDPDSCTACALCTDNVPEVFKMGDTYAFAPNPDVPATLEASVRGAAEDCPTSAIIIEE